jgi:ribosome-associated toxin RatA of RatAB toxin-antitoxin module
MIVRRSALLAQPAGHLFDVIEAAEHYPRFLPWCVGAVIISRDDEVVSADLQVRLAGMNFSMRTRNPKRRPEFMAIHLERGPFRRFEGEWHLTALSADACKVAFMLDYEFDSSFMTHAAGPVFRHAADTLMDAFVRHAQTLPVAPPAAQPPAAPPGSAPAPAVQPAPAATAPEALATAPASTDAGGAPT